MVVGGPMLVCFLLVLLICLWSHCGYLGLALCFSGSYALGIVAHGSWKLGFGQLLTNWNQ